MDKFATISDCGKYRYHLSRNWDDGLPECVFIMLNPSTADADNDDPTIRRCIDFAKRWGCGGLEVVNLFAYRATDPKVLEGVTDPVGPENWDIVYHTVLRNLKGVNVAAWGNGGKLLNVGDMMRYHLRDFELKCLKVTSYNQPCHPLYVPAKTDLKDLP